MQPTTDPQSIRPPESRHRTMNFSGLQPYRNIRSSIPKNIKPFPRYASEWRHQLKNGNLIDVEKRT